MKEKNNPHLDLWREQCKRLELVQRNNMDIPFHFHSPIEICYVEKGELEVYVNDQYTVLHPGEMSVALSYIPHCYRTVGEQSEASVMIIPTYLCPEFLSAVKNLRAMTPFIRDKASTTKIKEYYNEIKTDRQNKIKTIGYMHVILGIIMDSINFETIASDIDTRLSSRILIYINENYQKDISLTSIAVALGYNPSYLSRYFKSNFHIGINQYITLVRLKQFVILSKDREKCIATCAYESGFRSLRTFYRAFFDEFQCSPKDYLS